MDCEQSIFLHSFGLPSVFALTLCVLSAQRKWVWKKEEDGELHTL